MKYFFAFSLFIKNGLCLTDEERAAFLCRDQAHSQFTKSAVSGGSEFNVEASSSNDFFGCHPQQGTPCYKTDLACSITLTDATANTVPRILITANGIPDHTSWGLTGQDGSITEQEVKFRIPKFPKLLGLSEATATGQGAIAYAVNGVAIFGPYNTDCCDATFLELESMDYCLGHPANGNYHYHYFAHNTLGASGCLMSCSAGEVSDIVGVAKDGFPIYGPMQYFSPSDQKVYIDPSNCSDCELRQLMTEHLDICGGMEVGDGVVAEGTVYRYIVTGLFPYHFQCYRGKIALSQQKVNNQWTNFAVTNSCGIDNFVNEKSGADCEMFNQTWVDEMSCAVGDCPYTVTDLRAQDHHLSEVYHQCTGCTNDACIESDETTTQTTMVETTVYDNTTCPEGMIWEFQGYDYQIYGGNCECDDDIRTGDWLTVNATQCWCQGNTEDMGDGVYHCNTDTTTSFPTTTPAQTTVFDNTTCPEGMIWEFQGYDYQIYGGECECDDDIRTGDWLNLNATECYCQGVTEDMGDGVYHCNTDTTTSLPTTTTAQTTVFDNTTCPEGMIWEFQGYDYQIYNGKCECDDDIRTGEWVSLDATEECFCSGWTEDMADGVQHCHPFTTTSTTPTTTSTTTTTATETTTPSVETTTAFDPATCPDEIVSWKGASVSKLMFHSETGALVRVNFYNDAAAFDVVNDIYLGFMGYPRRKCSQDFVDGFFDGRISWKIYDFGNFYTPQYSYQRIDGRHTSVTLQFFRHTHSEENDLPQGVTKKDQIYLVLEGLDQVDMGTNDLETCLEAVQAGTMHVDNAVEAAEDWTPCAAWDKDLGW